MPGICPNEGEALRGNLIIAQSDVDRGTNLELLLFTNASIDETITAAALTEPSGTGYARITLVDGSWTGAADVRSYAEQTFTAGAGGWTGDVYGYAIVTTGTTPRILGIEVDPNGPRSMTESAEYKVTPQLTFT